MTRWIAFSIPFAMGLLCFAQALFQEIPANVIFDDMMKGLFFFAISGIVYRLAPKHITRRPEYDSQQLPWPL